MWTVTESVSAVTDRNLVDTQIVNGKEGVGVHYQGRERDDWVDLQKGDFMYPLDYVVLQKRNYITANHRHCNTQGPSKIVKFTLSNTLPDIYLFTLLAD